MSLCLPSYSDCSCLAQLCRPPMEECMGEWRVCVRVRVCARVCKRANGGLAGPGMPAEGQHL